MNKKILIADDHPAIRKGVKLILESEFPGSEFGEAVDGLEAVKKLKEEKWDLLILDIDMPGMNGLEVLKQLSEEKIVVFTLVFSLHPEEQIAIRAFKYGALGYLSKETA